jgi:hypothetical protein
MGKNNKTTKKKKEYKFYACYKDAHNGGVFCRGRDSCEEAFNDLQKLKMYVQNDLIFIGVIKCKDERPLKHILDI